MPKISVIIPTFNRANYISDGIDSVLAQTYKDFEIIIVDDGSIDSTKNILSRYSNKIKYFYKQNGGVASARNFGIQQAVGECIAFLDSDDLWLPDKLVTQHTAIMKSKAGLNYTSMIVVDEHGKPTGETKPAMPALCVLDLINGCRIPMTVLIKKNIFDSIGLFDENIKVGEDTDLWIRFAQHIEIEFINIPLAKCRRHSSNISSNKSDYYIGQIKILSKLINDHNVELSKKMLKLKLAREYYLLAKECYLDKKYSTALSYAGTSLKISPLVGICFMDSQDPVLKKAKTIIKPYLALLCYLFRRIIAWGWK